MVINGFSIVPSMQEADIIIFSGCGVLESNETEGIHIIQYIKNMLKDNNSRSKFILVGCLPKINKVTRGIKSDEKENKEGYLIEKEFISSEHEQFLVIDNYDYSLLDKVIDANIVFEDIPYPDKISAQNGLQQMKISNLISESTVGKEGKKQQQSYLELIKLQTKVVNMGFLFPASNDYLMIYGYRQIVIGYGCKNNCAYCAVKFAKNKIKSISLEKIIFQIKTLIAKGERKFVLVADDFGSWGLDLKSSWVELIKAIDKIDCPDIKIAIFNIKSEDMLEHKEVIDLLVEKKKLYYLCVMSQHINSRLLKLMKRKAFNKNAFLNLINEYGDKGVQVETFTIIGFPSETEDEFQELVDFVCSVTTPHFANYSTPLFSKIWYSSLQLRGSNIKGNYHGKSQ